MSESLNVDLSDDAYAELRRKADATGTTPSQLAARTLEEEYAPSSVPRSAAGVDSDPDTARERFERHFGSVDLGYDNKGRATPRGCCGFLVECCGFSCKQY